jgi:hypothetical protein
MLPGKILAVVNIKILELFAVTANYFRIFVPLTANCLPAIANSKKMGSTGIDRMEISR